VKNNKCKEFHTQEHKLLLLLSSCAFFNAKSVKCIASSKKTSLPVTDFDF
jgi:hypothetical protein